MTCICVLWLDGTVADHRFKKGGGGMKRIDKLLKGSIVINMIKKCRYGIIWISMSN